MQKKTLDKLVKLCKLLTSEYDGEILSAVDKITALIEKEGKEWDELLYLAPPKQPDEELQKAYFMGVNDGYRQAKLVGMREALMPQAQSDFFTVQRNAVAQQAQNQRMSQAYHTMMDLAQKAQQSKEEDKGEGEPSG